MAEDIIRAAQARYERDISSWSEIYQKAREDLHFLSDDMYAQWDQSDYEARNKTGRPAVTIDQLGQFIHQVANDIRMNTPTINVIPGDKESSEEVAEVYKGLIKNIEYVSNADDAYDTASLNAVKSSIGFIRVDHDYVDDEGFDQQLLIKRVTNPLACVIDRDSVECDGRDSKHGTIIDKILVADFKKQYPDFAPVSFDSSQKGIPKDDDYIAIAEHFVLVDETKEMGLKDDGSVSEVQKKGKYKSTRKIKKTKVMRYKLSGQDVLEETTFPGKYIPLVPVYGEEHWVEGKRNLFSLIRKSKSAQRMFNYWKSLETELLMKAPKAPIMAAEGQTEDYASDWTDPDKAAVLRYKTTDAQGNPAPPPQRLAPPQIPTGVINAARETVDDIKATMGIYGPALGQRSNETSGTAINARKVESDVATYHFGDNLVRSITQVGRIIVCAAPEIYDTQRIIRIIGEEDEPKSVGINGEMAEDQEYPIDLTKGKYDVKVTTGASFTTQRQETVAALTQIFSSKPELMSVFGDIFFKNSDFAGAQAMAERAKKLLPPNLQDEEEQDPRVQALEMQIMEAQKIMEGIQAEAAQLKAKLDSNEESNQLEREKMQMEYDLKMAEIEQKGRELEDKQRERHVNTGLELENLRHENLKARLEAKTKVHPEVAMSDPDMNEGEVAPVTQMLQGLAELLIQNQQQIQQGFEQMAALQSQGDQAIIQAVQAPRVTEVVRGEDGRITGGVSTVTMQ